MTNSTITHKNLQSILDNTTRSKTERRDIEEIILFLQQYISEEEIFTLYSEEKYNLQGQVESAKQKLLRQQGLLTPEDEESLEIDEYWDIWQTIHSRILKEKQPQEQVTSNITAEREKELEELRTKTEIIERIYDLDEQWMDCFNDYSFYNEDNGKNLFYVMLSTLTKDITNFNIVNGVQNMLHFFLVQSSGTGKDRGLDFMQKIVDIINELYKESDEYKELVEQAKEEHTPPPDKLIRCALVSGTETLETYQDNYDIDNKGNIIGMTKGILSSNDLILMRECSFLFSGKSAEGKQSKREIFLQAMEGRAIVKKLRGWKGMETETLCNACIVGISRPVDNMKEHMANTGLMQRGLVYMRKVSENTRLLMNNRMWSKGIIVPQGEKQKSDDKYRKLAKKLLTFRSFFKGKIFVEKPEQKEDIITVGVDRTAALIKKVEEFLIYPEQKEIARTFNGRLNGLIMLLSVFHASIRFSKEIDVVDIDRAIKHIERNFDSVLAWIGESIEVSKESKVKMGIWVKAIQKAYKKTFSIQQWITRAELFNELQSIMKLSSRPSMYVTFDNNYATMFEVRGEGKNREYKLKKEYY